MADKRGLQDGWIQVQDSGSPLVSLIGKNKETRVVLTPIAH